MSWWPPHGRPVRPESVPLRRAMWRFGGQVAAIFAAVVVLLTGIAVAIVLRGQSDADAALLRQATRVADDVTDPPAGGWLVIRNAQGQSATSGIPAGLPDTAALDRVARTGVAETGAVVIGGVRYEVYTERRQDDIVQAALSLAADHSERQRLLFTMLASGGVGLVLAAAVGGWLGRRAVRPMAAALALQQRFVSDASHELRTPLALLSTRAQLHRRHLRAGFELPTLLDEADGVVADANHLTDILEDLLLAADTRAQPRTEPVDLVALADQAVTAVAAPAADRSITVTARPEVAAVHVQGAPAGLRRAVTALLDNALRHAAAEVTVSVRRNGSDAVLDVTDDGPGIDPAMLHRLFERFASADRETGAPGARRYGIGLALVSEIVARHGGAVSAHTVPSGGARFRLTFPASRETASA